MSETKPRGATKRRSRRVSSRGDGFLNNTPRQIPRATITKMNLKINFLGEPQDPSRKRFFFFLKIFAGATLIVGLFGALASQSVVNEDGLWSGISNVPFVKRIRQLVHSADRSLAGERDDRINILLLGMGGENHDGPYLTDTIILASIKPSTKQIALLSIPRDLAAPIPGYGWYKLNHANAFGEEKASGTGAELTRTVLHELLDMPINYYVRIDFDGFVKLINDLGGIDVAIDRSFTDSTYPTDKNGEVTALSFEKGWEHMDGNRALEFARSRHGSNGEGSDFARGRRQQKIIATVKTKVFSLGTLRSPAKISSVLDALKNHVTTNFSPWELLAAARLASTLDTDTVITRVLDDGPNGLLAATTGVDGAYLLMPKGNDWSAVRSLVGSIFAETTTIALRAPVRVEIQNGTPVNGLASRTAETIGRAGFKVVSYGNAPSRTYTKTIIYDLSGGSRSEELLRLKNLLGADVLAGVPTNPGSEISTNEQSESLPRATAAPPPDFLIILGAEEVQP